MLGMTIWLGFNLFSGQRSSANDSRSVEQVLTDLRKHDAEVNAQAAEQDQQVIFAKLDDHATRNNWNSEQKVNFKHEVELLTLHTKMAAGIRKKDSNTIYLAFQTLEAQQRKIGKTDLWKKEFPVAKSAELPAERMSMDSLYAAGEADLKVRYKNELVWGFIPGYQIIDSLVKATGSVPNFSYALSALLLAIVVRAIIFVPVTKQMRWSKQMTQLKPLVDEMQKEYQSSDVNWRQNPDVQRKTMELYKRYGINPAGGCLPALIQIPFFWAIYQCMLHYRFEFRAGTFLWINPATHNANSFFSPNLGTPDVLLIIIYGVSMLISQSLQPVQDPNNAKQMRIMGIVMSLMVTVFMFFWPLPSAFVLYWIFLNVFATAHALWMNKQPVPPLQEVNAPGGGVFPTDPTVAGLFKNTGAPQKPKSQKPKKK